MGVPALFSWLVTRMEDLILYQKFPYAQMASLYLDMNGAIHPAVKNDPNMKETDMYEAVCQYFMNILSVAKPRKLVYIAMDGVAPKAKMDQQRIRRYKVIKETQAINELNLKYGKPVKSNQVDFNMISPGTVFMTELSRKLYMYIAKLQESADWKDVKFIISDSSEPGEGEHKIMNYIRSLKVTKKASVETDNICIYGLDADLMFLTMCIQRSNIFLMREAMLFQSGKKPVKVENEYNYLDIDGLKNCLINILNTSTGFDELSGTNTNTNTNTNIPSIFTNLYYSEVLDKKHIKTSAENYHRLIMDYVYLSFLLGNDFLPNLAAFKIRDNGLDILLQAYKMTSWSTGEFMLTNDYESVNLNFFKILCKYLVDVEDEVLTTMHNKKMQRIRQFKIRTELLEDYEREIEEMNYIEHKITYDPIKMGMEGWRARYYKCLFNISYRNRFEQIQQIKELCQNYLIGTIWVLKYYQGKLTDWRWSFNYDYGPSIHDIYQSIKNETGYLSVTFESTKPVSPFCQLMAILPPESSKLLPSVLGNLMTDRKSSLHYMYPLTYKYNFTNKRFLWECPLILPEIDIEKIEQAVMYYSQYLTESEIQRNTNK